MKRLFVVIVFLTFSSIAFAQFTFITPKIGFTLSKCKDFNNVKYKPGYLFGASVLYMLSPKFAIKPELLIEQKGFMDKIEYTDANGRSVGSGIYSMTWNYLTLPLQIQYGLFKNNIVFISAGGYAGYMLWGTDRTLKGTGEVTNSRERLDISYYNRLEVGVNAGCGVAVPIHSQNKIDVGFKYEHALRIEKSNFPTGTNTFSLSVGYGINIAK